MTAAKGFYFTTQLKISSDLLVVENAKAVDHGDRVAGPFYDLIGYELHVLLVGHGEDQCINTAQGCFQVFFNYDINQSVLVPEKAFPGIFGAFAILCFKFMPVIDIRVVHMHVGTHLGKLSDHHLGTTVSCISHILAVAGTTEQHPGTGNIT